MIERSNTEEITSLLNKVSGLAREELVSWFNDVVSQNLPRDVERELIIAKMVSLNEQYGGISSTVASDWYVDLREQEKISGSFVPAEFSITSQTAIRKNTRWALGDYYKDGNPQKTLKKLDYVLDKAIKETGTHTVHKTSLSDPASKGWARVPAGKETCAFCCMLASRGFVYRNEASAGKKQKFHSGCDCQIVPFWSKSKVAISGYDPDALYAEYQEAYSEVASRKQNDDAPTAVEIASAMKNLNPQRYKVAVSVPPILTSPDLGWPADKFEPVSDKVWRHILKRHGEDGTAVSKFKDLDHDEIAMLIVQVLQNPDRVESSTRWKNTFNYFKNTEQGEIMVGTTKTENGLLVVKTAYRPESMK